VSYIISIHLVFNWIDLSRLSKIELIHGFNNFAMKLYVHPCNCTQFCVKNMKLLELSLRLFRPEVCSNPSSTIDLLPYLVPAKSQMSHEMIGQ
jgi:hypothetical protein